MRLIDKARRSQELDTCRACGDGFIDELADEIELLNAECNAWKKNRDFRVKEHLADKEHIAKLEARYDKNEIFWQNKYAELEQKLHYTVNALDRADRFIIKMRD